MSMAEILGHLEKNKGRWMSGSEISRALSMNPKTAQKNLHDLGDRITRCVFGEDHANFYSIGGNLDDLPACSMWSEVQDIKSGRIWQMCRRKSLCADVCDGKCPI
jgi:hypothetical protein